MLMVVEVENNDPENGVWDQALVLLIPEDEVEGILEAFRVR